MPIDFLIALQIFQRRAEGRPIPNRTIEVANNTEKDPGNAVHHVTASPWDLSPAPCHSSVEGKSGEKVMSLQCP